MFVRQPRIVLVTRETRLQGLLNRWATKGQALYMFRQAAVAAAVQAGDTTEAMRAQADASDEEFDELAEEDATYENAVRSLARKLDFGIPVQVIERRFVPTLDFGLCSAVIVVGQDGLVANTAKYVGDVPIVGVNPDPDRIDGVLLPFSVGEARSAVSRVLQGQAKLRSVTLAQVTLHDGQTMLAFNDLFVGVKSHVSARYVLRVGGKEEPQSSSGLLVSTAAGSTGWMSSVFNMARGVSQSLGAQGPQPSPPRMRWDDPRLLWAVREPFLSRTSGATLVAGTLEAGQEIEVESVTPANGVIFSDGIETDFLDFNGGTIARIGVAQQRARLVVT